ncbi:hypothetical protein LY474_19370 [Myxococcus stipitatus]|uniref:hypothetical protein n=1 Tax=Myxococcus stipitatus TaxID=83455 RepID=UPI001F189463|nr:hypothetical protein [Myxococcus stipitatus]MCE9669963.1 hypothetical protein [Myxococcus stipitatus]
MAPTNVNNKPTVFTPPRATQSRPAATNTADTQNAQATPSTVTTQETKGAESTAPAKKDAYAGKKESAAQAGKPQLESTLDHPTVGLNKATPKPATLQRRDSVDLAKFQQGAEEMRRTLNPQTRIDPSPHIQKICNAINKQVPNAKVLHYIDQSSNPIMANPEVKAAFSEGSEGVCSYMTTQWIRMNEAAPSQAKAVEDFSQLVEFKFGNLIIGQQKEAEMITKLKSELVTNINTEIAQAKKLDAELKTVLKDKGESAPEVQNLVGSLQTVYGKLDKLEKDLDDVNNHMRRGELIHKGTIGELAKNLESTPLPNGYYRLSMTPKKDSNWDGDESGHVVGMHKTDTTCRFMDANTAEWEVPNPSDLNKIANEHVKKMYTSSFFASSGSGFNAGDYELRRVSTTP